MFDKLCGPVGGAATAQQHRLIDSALPGLVHSSESAWGPLQATPGRVVGLIGAPGSGLTSIALAALASQPGIVAVVDVRGWFSPAVAWDAGITLDRLVIIRPDDVLQWGRVTAALLEGVQAVYAEVPERAKDAALRKLAALARRRPVPLWLRPLGQSLPSGLTHLTVSADAVDWLGPEAGHGRLMSRRLALSVSGKAIGGIRREVEVEVDGANAVHVVPRLAAAEAGRAAG